VEIASFAVQGSAHLRSFSSDDVGSISPQWGIPPELLAPTTAHSYIPPSGSLSRSGMDCVRRTISESNVVWTVGEDLGGTSATSLALRGRVPSLQELKERDFIRRTLNRRWRWAVVVVLFVFGVFSLEFLYLRCVMFGLCQSWFREAPRMTDLPPRGTLLTETNNGSPMIKR